MTAPENPNAAHRFARALLVHNQYRQRTGEDRTFDAVTELLRSQEHEVLPFVLDNCDLDERDGPGVAARAAWNRRSYREIGDLVRRHKPDAAHFHNIQPQVLPAGYHAAADAGVPCIASGHSALTELIAHGETGLLFAPGDAVALAGQLARAAAEPASMAALGETAHQRFSERFSAEKKYAELIDIYTAAARRSAERRVAAAG